MKGVNGIVLDGIPQKVEHVTPEHGGIVQNLAAFHSRMGKCRPGVVPFASHDKVIRMLLGVFDHEGPLAAADFHFDVAVFVREHVLPLEGELVGLAVGRADGLSSVVAPEHVVPEPLLFGVFA